MDRARADAGVVRSPKRPGSKLGDGEAIRESCLLDGEGVSASHRTVTATRPRSNARTVSWLTP